MAPRSWSTRRRWSCSRAASSTMSRRWSVSPSRGRTPTPPRPAAAATPSACDPAAMKIATWNVNSVRKRTGNLVSWLQSAKPDVVVLQEIKAQEPQFPKLEIEAAGYKTAIVGQKGFNGVAFLSLHPFDVTARTLPGHADDEPARYVEGRVATPRGPLTVGGIYLPNGNPIGTEKFTY